MPKLLCPKCKNDSFKISLTERQETYDDPSATRRIKIVTILNITCSRCGWNQHFRKA